MSEVPQQLTDFDFIIHTSLENFVIACQPLHNELMLMADQVKRAFLATKDLVIYGLVNPEPEKDHPLMISYTEAIRSVVDSKAKGAPQEFANHLASIREAILALGFMTVRPAPTQFIRDLIDASEYYSMRILTQNKGVEKHILFVTKIRELFSDLLQYVKKHHLTGFAWNSVKKSSIQAAFPPPPPPPPSFCDTIATGDGARVALLNQLNQGSGITNCLRPVKRSGTASEPVREELSAKSPASSGKPAPPKTYSPIFFLDGRKWRVEHQNSNLGLVINNESMSESVACYKMDNSNLSISNKVNSLVIDTCRKSAVCLKSVIACVELIRCDKVTITCEGVVPLINLENCTEIQVFLSTNSRNVEIVSSKCSSCNVCLLDEDGSYKELPIVEQIKTVVHNDKLVSTVVEKN